MAAGTIKTTVVLVATGDETEVFRSLESVPLSIRKRMLKTAARGNSATILIADRRGRQELARAIQGQSSAVRLRATVRPAQRLRRLVALYGDWIDLALLCAAGAFLWAAALYR